MIYAEKYNENGIGLQKAIFYTLSEFLPYRADGWSATLEYNRKADERLLELENTPLNVLKYMSPMIRTGEDYRFELVRRLKNNP